MVRLRTRPGGRLVVPVELPCTTGEFPRHEQLVNIGLGMFPPKFRIVKCQTCGKRSRLTYEQEGERYYLVGEVVN